MTEDNARAPASVIFIYGPPGVGKLTVAREVAGLTGARLFDNHMSIDWAQQIFPGGSVAGFEDDSFARLRDRLRLAVFEEAARAGIGVVFTYVYAAGADDPYVQRMCDAVEAEGGRMRFVQLSCEGEVHAERVIAPGRRERGKISSPELLREVMSELDLVTPIPGRESLHIDTTGVAAADVALRIVEHFGLRGERT